MHGTCWSGEGPGTAVPASNKTYSSTIRGSCFCGASLPQGVVFKNLLLILFPQGTLLLRSTGVVTPPGSQSVDLKRERLQTEYDCTHLP